MHTFDGRFPNLRILTLTEEADVKRLLFLFSQSYGFENLDILEDEPRLAKITPRLLSPALMIAEMVLPNRSRSLGIQSVIVESDYIDRDFNILYARHYARAFRDCPRRTIRLNFFSQLVTSCDELINNKSLRDSFIGFCVLSANRPGNIGRTVLPPSKRQSSWIFVPAQAEFSINLAGADLKAMGTAFIQQDGRAAACASAATWMSVIMIAQRSGSMSYSMADITELATRFSLPRTWGGSGAGLDVEHILWALHEMNYEPVSYDVKDVDLAKEVIYNYVESGISPILVIRLPKAGGYHAVTAVGHTYCPTVNIEAKTNISESSVLPWCPYFLAHDDQNGPYIGFRIDSPNDQSEGRPTFVLDENDSLPIPFKQSLLEWYRNASLYYIVAPLPPRHALRPEEAAAKARAIYEHAFKLCEPNLTRLSKIIPEHKIFRTYLISSNEFKRNISKRSMSSELAHWYRGSIYPRYIWVTELCSLEHRINKEPADNLIIADVTIDPTSSRYTEDFVTLHIPNFFFRMPPMTINVATALANPVAFIPNDAPYQPLVRLEASHRPIINSY